MDVCVHSVTGPCAACSLEKIAYEEQEAIKKIMKDHPLKILKESDMPNPFPIIIPPKGWGRGPYVMPKFGGDPSDVDGETIRIWGQRKTGKSAWGEAACIKYLQNGGSIYDLLGADDDESLVWLESPYRERVVLLIGNATKMPPPYDLISIKIKDFHPETAPNGKIYLTSKAFFWSEDLYYAAITKLVNGFLGRKNYTHTHVLFFREVGQFLMSQMRTGQAHNSKEAEEKFIRFHWQALHHGLSLIVDTQRNIDLHKSFRDLADWTIVKNIGDMEWPREKRYMLGIIDPVFLRTMEPHQFVMFAGKQTVGAGVFDLPPFHLVRGTSVMTRLGLDGIDWDIKAAKLELGKEKEELGVGDQRQKVTQEIHEEMINMQEAGTSQRDIAAQLILGVKFSLTTVKNEMSKHKFKTCGCDFEEEEPEPQ